MTDRKIDSLIMAAPRTKIRPSKAIDALPALCDVKQAARALGLNPETLRQHARANKLPGARLWAGRDWAIPKAAILDFYAIPCRG